MAYQILLGSSAWDAVNYCRQLLGDTSATPVIPDSAFQSYHEQVVEDFSRYVPLDYQVGNPVAATSGLNTVANQQRYVCSSGNGFTAVPSRVTDVLYQATNAFSAASEISYLALLPFSPINRFLFTPSLLDSPSERILRDEYLSELDHYGRGYYGFVRDPATGLMAIDLYPIPTSSGIPIYVRYQSSHVNVPSGGNAAYATVPEAYKRQFAELLFCQVLESQLYTYSVNSDTRAGILQGRASPEMIERQVRSIRQRVYRSLGGAAPVAVQTF